MADRLEFTLAAGPHRRRNCPVKLAAPAGLDRPTLQREGRARGVVCQTEVVDGQSWLWWILEGLPPSGTQRYTVWAEDRQRLPRARVRIRPSAYGLLSLVRGRPVAEVLLPKLGPPQVSLRPDDERLLSVVPRCRDDGIHYKRRGKPQARRGPVFASLSASYERLDALDRVMGREEHRFRFFDGSPAHTPFDWEFRLVAATGPIELTDGLSPRFSILPTPSRPLAVGPGWVEPTDLGGRRASGAAVVGERNSGMVVFAGDEGRLPPRWNAGSAGAVDAVVCSGAAGSRLELGERMVCRIRIAAFRARDARRFAEQRAVDFDCPPSLLSGI